MIVLRFSKQVALTLLAVAYALTVPTAASASTEQANVDYFEKKVRPLFVARCYKCHSSKEQKGGLRLDSRRAVLAGGDLGASVVPDKPDESLLISAVRYGPTVQMPPDGRLSDADVAVLVEWVRRGAPWPDDGALSQPDQPAATPFAGELFTDEQRSFWAFRSPVDSPLPEVNNKSWPVSAIDHFVLARLEAAGLAPAPPADKRTLLRRATFDLTGLPPSPDEMDNFLADDSPGAVARAVDRLLASPAYGQRWGRHWLDIARYADSNGLDENLAYVNAYRYRDYVVSAFNRDLPYDQFVVEQLAGDLLPSSGNRNADHERLVATGFLTLGAKMLAEDDPAKMEMDIIDEQIDTVGVALMGMTLGCARCHDHKFDPIPTADYYSLAGIFKSTKTMDNFSVVAVWHERPLAEPEQVAAVEAHRQRVAEKKAAIDQLVKNATEELAGELRRDAWRYLQAATEMSRWGFSLTPSQTRDQQPAGSLVIEAENFARGQATKVFEGYGAGIGIIASFSPEPSFAEYDLELADGGVYLIELRYAAADPRPVTLLVDGVAIKGDAANQATGSWNPDTQAWFAEAVVSLSPGKHTLRLDRREPFPHLDRLALVPVSLPASIESKWFTPGAAEADGQPPLRWGVLQRWQKALAQAKNQPEHVLHAWHLLDSSQAATEAKPPVAPPPTSDVLRDPPPANPDELIARYRDLFERAEAAWREREKSPGAEKPAHLDDPALEAARAFLYEPDGPCSVPTPAEIWLPGSAKSDLARWRDELAEIERSAPAPLPLAMAVEDRDATDVRIHIRGNHLTQGEEVPRRFPRILAGEDQPALPARASGRLELARWLTRGDHPSTSRVMVNRVWQGHFGEGLVRSPDNFGRLGERPSHPELLDWLACRFVEDGWSLKLLHRRIMLSAAYQMSSSYDARAAEIDPDNRLLWRMNRRRLEAEAVRDAILAVSGRLERSFGGSLLAASPRQYVASTTSVDNTQYDSLRRSIYLPVIRSALFDVFQAFDFAEPSVPNGSRAATTVAPQALFMMNGPLVTAETKHLAGELLRTAADDAARVQSLYRQVLARAAAAAEVERALQFVGELESNTAWQALSPPERRQKAWQSLCRVVLASNEFLYVP